MASAIDAPTAKAAKELTLKSLPVGLRQWGTLASERFGNLKLKAEIIYQRNRCQHHQPAD